MEGRIPKIPTHRYILENEDRDIYGDNEDVNYLYDMAQQVNNGYESGRYSEQQYIEAMGRINMAAERISKPSTMNPNVTLHEREIVMIETEKDLDNILITEWE